MGYKCNHKCSHEREAERDLTMKKGNVKTKARCYSAVFEDGEEGPMSEGMQGMQL